MEKQGLISVIVPVYNVEKYLEACIKSIVNQTYKHLQIILVDDGSTDSSGQICDLYEKRDGRIRVIHQKNAGLVSARKTGLMAADGEYVGFVDSDDYIDADMYQDLLQAIRESQADFVHTGYFDERNGVAKAILQYEEAKSYLADQRIKFMQDYVLKFNRNHNMLHGVVVKLFKRELITKCYQNVPDCQSYGEDLLATCACVLESGSVYMKKKAYYHYVYRMDSLSRKNDEVRMAVSLAELYKSLQGLFKQYGCSEALEDALNYWFKENLQGVIATSKDSGICIHRYFYPDVLKLQNKRIVLYGAGIVGQDYYAQLCKYQQCRIVAWADGNAQKYDFEYMQVVGMERIREFDYDIVVLAVAAFETAEAIRRDLIKSGVEDGRIVWMEPRYALW